MTVLDCGCGPGTITISLAAQVPESMFTGIDLSQDQVDRASASAMDQGISNVHFESGSVYELPFPSDSFDAVFSNAVLQHLADPVAAIGEFRRVLKQNGVLALRAPVHNLDMIHPPDANLTRFMTLFSEVVKDSGGDLGLGVRLGEMMRGSGFSNVSMSASHDYYSSGKAAQSFSEQAAGLPILGEAAGLGLTTEDETQEISAAWLRWGALENAFFARAYGEAVGWKA